MGKINRKIRPIIVNMKFQALESLKGNVKKFGDGGAHIPFSADYIGYEVAVVPIRRIKNAN